MKLRREFRDQKNIEGLAKAFLEYFYAIVLSMHLVAWETEKYCKSTFSESDYNGTFAFVKVVPNKETSPHNSLPSFI